MSLTNEQIEAVYVSVCNDDGTGTMTFSEVEAGLQMLGVSAGGGAAAKSRKAARATLRQALASVIGGGAGAGNSPSSDDHATKTHVIKDDDDEDTGDGDDDDAVVVRDESQFRTLVRWCEANRGSSKRLLTAFSLFDQDRHGFITVADLRRVCNELGEPFTDAQLAEMVREADPSGKGKVDLEKYLSIMQEK